MSIYKHYIQTAAHLIGTYDGSFPLHHFLKQFFSQHKKYGSRDRKLISGLCYNYYRLGKTLATIPVEEKVVIALFVCSNTPNMLLANLRPDLNENVAKPLLDKLQFVEVNPTQIFSFSHLSERLGQQEYALSMLRQPGVFIRVRPQQERYVEDRLKTIGWTYHKRFDHTIELDPGVPVDKNFKLNKEVIIQDLNSQRVGVVIKNVFAQNNFTPKELWDCCAASGGKSLMMNDIFPNLKLMVSDIRNSILQNLSKRFYEAGITGFHAFVADLSSPQKTAVKPSSFIIADVPCTGSGTWARTPEQLYFFDENTIASYAKRQLAIATNALKYLLPGGWIVYITCSIFKQENEDVVNELMKNPGLLVIHQQLLNGVNMKADSMFVAIMHSTKA